MVNRTSVPRVSKKLNSSCENDSLTPRPVTDKKGVLYVLQELKSVWFLGCDERNALWGVADLNTLEAG